MCTSLTVRACSNEQQKCRFHCMSLPTEPDVCVGLMSSSTCWPNWFCSSSLSYIYKPSTSLPTLLHLPSRFCSINWCVNAPVLDISGGKPVPDYYLYADLLRKPSVLSPSGDAHLLDLSTLMPFLMRLSLISDKPINFLLLLWMLLHFLVLKKTPKISLWAFSDVN